MEKQYQPSVVEGSIYQMWEKGGYFTPKIDWKKIPFTIILPLPNANDPLHMGHALFTVEDIMVRYHRMRGEPTLWLPGGDHAGIETQFVFEKHLKKEGKSRYNFDRETLYRMIWEFAEKNKNVNKEQMKRLGFSLDWTRYHYSLEPEMVERVLETFRRLHDDGLIYRGERIVNFCTKCGTAFSELEVNYEEREDFLYFLDYGPIQIATTRPETIFADVAVAVNPKDKRYKKLIGRKAVIPLINLKIPIITAEEIDMKFGTGALKVTPGYDPVDFEIGQRNNLEIVTIFDRQGRMMRTHQVPQELEGLSVNQARAKTVELLGDNVTRIEPLIHSVGTCYRCGTTIEPVVIPQWFVKMKSLAAPAIAAVKRGRTKIVPKKRFEKMYFDWLENIKDWNISRQIVWGPRIPVWYCLCCNPDLQLNFLDEKGQKVSGIWQELKGRYSFTQVKKGLQSLVVAKEALYQLGLRKCTKCGGKELLQETDTFDTWFLSGQWPVNTLKSQKGDFEYFYPTSVLDTLWDILFFWVGRMMMLGIYLTGKAPFKVIHIHARVVDKLGRKMSKSIGNVMDPLALVDKYGADALRLALVIGVAPASDICLTEEKVRGMRNFANKIWNIGRFISMNLEGQTVPWCESQMAGLTAEDKKIVAQLEDLIKKVTKDLDNYRFGQAAENIYQFIWHELADKYIEQTKPRLRDSTPGVGRDDGAHGGVISTKLSKTAIEDRIVALSVLRHAYLNCLKLLHPFMPYVTEAVWQQFPRKGGEPLIVSAWPEVAGTNI